VTFTAETLAALAERENIVGVKEASGNIAFAAKIASMCGLDLYSGNDDMVVPLLSLGGKGVISVAANILPREMHEMCAAYFAGDGKRALELQLKTFDLIEKLFVEVNPIPVKAAMNLLGMKAGLLRLPLCEPSPENLEKLKKSMTQYGLL
jgi:4-hydroxy-tetrahydrodipicolinate synthase